VLARFLRAAEATGADVIVRLTADCPLLSPSVSSSVVAALDDSVDYASNTLDRTWPRGLDTEVITADVLRIAGREAQEPVEREHVTPFIYRRPERFRLRSVRSLTDRSQLRWTVDTTEDLSLVRAIHDELGPGPFDLDHVLAFLERRPELLALNAAVRQKLLEP
jgi:spore coat polysaccharide biosynthesis protein SpsF